MHFIWPQRKVLAKRKQKELTQALVLTVFPLFSSFFS